MNTEPPQLFTALNHVLRRRILRAFEDDGQLTSPTQFAQALDVALSNVNYHVTVLADTGALALVETRSVRGAKEHFYRLALDGQADWVYAALEASRESDEAGSAEEPDHT